MPSIQTTSLQYEKPWDKVTLSSSTFLRVSQQTYISNRYRVAANRSRLLVSFRDPELTIHHFPCFSAIKDRGNQC